MPVRGAKEVATALREAPNAVRRELAAVVAEIADLILRDMVGLVRKDTGGLAQALDKVFSESGLSARIGLVTAKAAADFFYARFLELGTKGGEVRYRRRGQGARWHTMQVPARPATPFMQPSLDMNRDDLERLVWEAIREGLRQSAGGARRPARSGVRSA